ncbi:hypothetical protein EGH10_15095 [Brevibacillus laterosporus]|uniref:SLH domain-containing protein n=1 Tax=Brevibacillus laterosporus LMG 15441 TaxID=1042163 RepID=A0A075R308_BRELA|nr:hypothetical protein [Brevibacillus laterosporus]AIG26927.1 hypothetical protein BRLA_c026080 [Brevibacillus laterosporus LMG 15441]RJL14600.1 hypothetical protein DM460_02990 [Brevibacillus laterosporus]TPH09588.1 hypothetical protein EGH10_15095 [Brevibacillus laterosporus]
MKRTLHPMKKPGLAFVLALSVLTASSSVYAKETLLLATQGTSSAVTAPHLNEYAQFLQTNYQLTFSKQVTRADYLQALSTILALQPSKESKISFTDVKEGSTLAQAASALQEQGIVNATTLKPNESLTAQDAISYTVRAAGLKELAYTYQEAKVKKAFSSVALSYKTGQLPMKAAQEIAVAIDTKLLPESLAQTVIKNQAVSPDVAALLIGKVLEYKGEYKHFLGLTTDEDIYSKVSHSWKTTNLIKAEELQKIVDEALKQDIVTGYNLKDKRFAPRFDPALSLTYGHSDIQHAIQLIGLLKSEGLVAKVQLEPKTSAFIYLAEWGQPVITPDYQVVKIDNGKYIAYSKEYDISFEFTSVADKEAFDKIIHTYAKKDKENQTGLLISSWWQPLYFSLNEMNGYKQITNNYMEKDNYVAQSFSLNEKSAQVVDGFKKIDPKVKVTSYPFYVDAPFYNYLIGDYK